MLKWLTSFFLHPKLPIFTVISVCWMVLLVLPFAIIGETWGMVWYLLTFPLSELLKETWETVGVIFYVGLVSFLHGLAIFILLNGGMWIVDAIKTSKSSRDADEGDTAQPGASSF